MKTFYQLSESEQLAAILFAKETLIESINLGLIVSRGQAYGNAEIHKLAVQAAEGSNYTDEGRPLTEEGHLPYYFQGGCV